MLGLIDESAPESVRGLHYVIGAAVLIDPGQAVNARERITKLTGFRQNPFHWAREGPEKRMAMVELLGTLEVGVFATIHPPVAARRQEHARGRSLRQLVAVLSSEGVDELILESRGPQNVHDRRTIPAGSGARNSGSCHSRTRTSTATRSSNTACGALATSS